jgi:hypothetical protein
MSEREIGFDKETTLNRLQSLYEQRIKIWKIMDAKGYLKDNKPKPMTANLPEQVVLQAELDDLQRAINETREYYTLHLLESLESSSKELNIESKKLNKLTGVLLAFTVLLSFLTLALLIRR